MKLLIVLCLVAVTLAEKLPRRRVVIRRQRPSSHVQLPSYDEPQQYQGYEEPDVQQYQRYEEPSYMEPQVYREPTYTTTTRRPYYQSPSYTTTSWPQYQPPSYTPTTKRPQYQPPSYTPTTKRPQYQSPSYHQPQYQPQQQPHLPHQQFPFQRPDDHELTEERRRDRHATITHYTNERHNDGGVSHAFKTDNGLEREETIKLKRVVSRDEYGEEVVNMVPVVSGSFQFLHDDGTVVTRSYTTDDHGHLIWSGTDLPKVPPVPAVPAAHAAPEYY